MNEHHLTLGNFDRDNGVRHILRYGHWFEHADLEHAKEIIGAAIEHVEPKEKTTGMGADHLDTAMKFLNKDHAGWKALPDFKKQHIEAALKEHFKIPEPKQEVA